MHISFGMPMIFAEHDFRRARPALARLAIPPHRQVVGLFRLDLVHHIQHHHALGDFRLILFKRAAGPVAAPDLERHRAHDFISSTICFIASVIAGNGSRSRIIEPSAPGRMVWL